MEIYEYDSAVAYPENQIFPTGSINEKLLIGFHATSSHYSSNIENSGIKSAFVSNNLLEEKVVKILIKHSILDELAAYKLATVSFAIFSKSCLDFITKDKLGGQRTKIIEDALVKLEANISNISPSELSVISEYRTNATAVRSASGVIYACDLSNLPETFYRKITKTLTINKLMPADRIIAKMTFNATPPQNTIEDRKSIQEAINNVLKTKSHPINSIPHIN